MKYRVGDLTPSNVYLKLSSKSGLSNGTSQSELAPVLLKLLPNSVQIRVNKIFTSHLASAVLVSETLASKGTNQRTEKACLEQEDLAEDTLDTVVDGKKLREIIPTLPFTLQFNRNLKTEDWKDMDQVLQLHQLLKDLFQWSMDNKRFNLASHWEELGASCQKIYLKEIDFRDLMLYIRTADPDRAYSDSFRVTRIRPNQVSSGFTPFRNQHISGQESPFFTLPGIFQEKTRIQAQKQDHLQPEEERVRPNDPETVGFGERSAQEPKVAVHNSRISSFLTINITPTQIEHNVLTPESNLNSDALWLQMSQYSEKTQKQFAELEASHERMKKLTASMDKIVETLQEGHAQLSKASEETNKRLNLVFEEQNHRKRDRDCLDQDVNKLFNVYHRMEHQPQGHVMDNPYHQDDIKPYAMLINKERSPSPYQDEDHMSYSEKEALKKLPDTSIWPQFSGTGKYDCMKLIDYIYGLFIDVPRIPDDWITAILNTEFKGHASIWYTDMKEIHGGRFKSCKSTEMSKRLKAIYPQMNIQMRNEKLLAQMPRELENAVTCICNHNCTLDDIENTLQDVKKRTNIGKYTPYKSSGFIQKQPFRVEFKDKPRERGTEVAK
ncbi:hypothetical protein O181_031443 [Austropuccinia psidii MF-1]|uniref:Uncharacterized protein n=1 Tax=Austropuccinia psidii MF-1 TaxID=1389203 RepID=A0A9Q3CZP6_9BASI|nr:hypothetical protein [Austropuccinia psidii MF-1]